MRGFLDIAAGIVKYFSESNKILIISVVLKKTTYIRPPFSNIFPLKPLGQSKPNFMWSLLVGTNVYIYGPGHITLMAARPIYGKNFKKASSLEPEVL